VEEQGKQEFVSLLESDGFSATGDRGLIENSV
jgi:hypothetical protein